jgi:hypothetical protein
MPIPIQTGRPLPFNRDEKRRDLVERHPLKGHLMTSVEMAKLISGTDHRDPP